MLRITPFKKCLGVVCSGIAVNTLQEKRSPQREMFEGRNQWVECG
ncbi:MAG: hypothetical protein ACK5AW_16460 [Pseudanabaena sp.]